MCLRCLLKLPRLAVKHTHTHTYKARRVCVILLQQDYASKPVSSICGWLLIPSKEVCSGQFHYGPLMLHVNIQVYRVGEAVTQSEVKSLNAWIFVVVGGYIYLVLLFVLLLCGLLKLCKENQYANMLLDINGKMVRRVHSSSCFVCVCFMCSVSQQLFTHSHLLPAGFSYRRMCRTNETDSRANSGKGETDFVTSGIMSFTTSVSRIQG